MVSVTLEKDAGYEAVVWDAEDRESMGLGGVNVVDCPDGCVYVFDEVRA